MLRRAPIRLLLPIVTLVPLQAHAQVTTELDALWAEVARSVATGDADLYLSTYHPDAIFVSSRRGITRTVAEDVEANRAAWSDTREGRARRSVEFRFTERVNSETSAHEVGIFRYASTEADGSTRVALIHFEAALVKKDGVWLQLLELQTSDATAAEWEAAR
jgi:ketosteroid isomerase-like protein